MAKVPLPPLGSGARFKNVMKSAKGARNPAGVAAAAGMKKYGKERMMEMAAAGRRKKGKKKKKKPAMMMRESEMPHKKMM